MLTFKQFRQQIYEGNKVYSQIEKPLSQGKELGVVSAKHYTATSQENKASHKRLNTDLNRLRTKGALSGYHKAKGRYQYDTGATDKEPSYVVRQGSGSKAKHFNTILKALGNRYKQNSIMKIHPNKETEYQYL